MLPTTSPQIRDTVAIRGEFLQWRDARGEKPADTPKCPGARVGEVPVETRNRYAALEQGEEGGGSEGEGARAKRPRKDGLGVSGADKRRLEFAWDGYARFFGIDPRNTPECGAALAGSYLDEARQEALEEWRRVDGELREVSVAMEVCESPY